MNNESIAEIKRNLLELGLLSPEDIVGCYTSEINEIMLAQRVTRLPTVYRDFLSHMGHWAGGYLGMRVNFYYTWLLHAKADAIEILQEEKAPMQLPDDAFVFFAEEQGYMFWFFHTSEVGDSDDIDFYEYMEGRESFVNKGSLLGWYQREFDRLVHRGPYRRPSASQGSDA